MALLMNEFNVVADDHDKILLFAMKIIVPTEKIGGKITVIAIAKMDIEIWFFFSLSLSSQRMIKVPRL
jgi:hypothetical protein